MATILETTPGKGVEASVEFSGDLFVRRPPSRHEDDVESGQSENGEEQEDHYPTNDDPGNKIPIFP